MDGTERTTEQVDLRHPDAYVVTQVAPAAAGLEVQVSPFLQALRKRRQGSAGLVGEGFFVQQALDFLRSNSGQAGLEDTQLPEFEPDPHVVSLSSGARAVHLRQEYKGIRVFQAAAMVRFGPQEEAIGSTGQIVAVGADLDTTVRVSAAAALLVAASYLSRTTTGETERDMFGNPIPTVGVDLTGFKPVQLLVVPNDPQQTTVFERGVFAEPVTTSLVWMPLARGQMHLAWEMTLSLPRQRRYLMVVDAQAEEANAPRVLYSQPLDYGLTARGNVHPQDGGTPREVVSFPRIGRPSGCRI